MTHRYIPFTNFLRFIGLGIFAILLTVFEQKDLPDYWSYEDMFYDFNDYDFRYSGFTMLASVWQQLGYDYDSFRLLVVGFGLILTNILLLNNLRNNSKIQQGVNNSRQRELLILILIFFFIFEFFSVRLRAGLSIFFFLIPILATFNTKSVSRSPKLMRIVHVAFFSFSFALHMQTFITMTAFVLLPLTWGKIISNSNSIKKFIMCALFLWFLIFFYLRTASEVRGEHLYSELNDFRFVAISIIPIVIWAFVLRTYRKPSSVNFNEWITWRVSNFPYMFSCGYVSAAVSLFIVNLFFPSDIFGEAVVRIMTLSSVGAILSLAIGGINMRNILPLYILVANEAFFINTVFSGLLK